MHGCRCRRLARYRSPSECGLAFCSRGRLRNKPRVSVLRDRGFKNQLQLHGGMPQRRTGRAFGYAEYGQRHSAAIVVCGLVAAIIWAGCGSVSQVPVATHQGPWDERRAEADLAFFEDPGASEAPYTSVTAYAAAQMYGLQPALAHGATVPYVALADGGGTAEGYNVMAYAAGIDPVRASELVIVGADLDGPAPNIGLAALMAVARNYREGSSQAAAPNRTIMFAAFEGSGEAYSGLRAYFRHPLWPTSKTTALLYLAPGDSSSLSEVVAEACEEIPLTVIAAPAITDSSAVGLEAVQLAQEVDRLLQRAALQ